MYQLSDFEEIFVAGKAKRSDDLKINKSEFDSNSGGLRQAGYPFRHFMPGSYDHGATYEAILAKAPDGLWRPTGELRCSRCKAPM